MENNSYTIMLAKIQVHRKTEEIIKNALDDLNISTREWLCLGSLRGHGDNAEPSVVAQELQVSLSLVTRMTKSLQAKGFIRILQPQDDKRRRRLELTNEGARTLQLSDPAVRKALKSWLMPLDRADVDTYMKVLLQVAYKL